MEPPPLGELLPTRLSPHPGAHRTLRRPNRPCSCGCRERLPKLGPLLPPLGGTSPMAWRGTVRLQHVPARMPADVARPHRHPPHHHPQPRRCHAGLCLGNDPLWDRPPPPRRRPPPPRPLHPPTLVRRRLRPRRPSRECRPTLPTPVPTGPGCWLLPRPGQELRGLPPRLRANGQSRL